MREIKFRAFNRNTGEMVPPFGFNDLTGFDDGFVYIFDLDGTLLSDNEELRIMQFTGLKDKNGNEIYEGDIVRVHFNGWEEVQPITWERSGWSAHDPWETLDFPCQERLEVIGNLYENPELLK